MNWESVKINTEVVALRTKYKLRWAIGTLGIIMVLVAAFNMLMVGAEPIYPAYRQFASGVVVYDTGRTMHIADALLMGIGAIAAWFS